MDSAEDDYRNSESSNHEGMLKRQILINIVFLKQA